MPIYASDVSFCCPECGDQISEMIDVPETNWIGDNAEERVTYEVTEIECAECNTWFAVDVTNYSGSVIVTLQDHDDTEVIAGDAYPRGRDEADFYTVPERPDRNLYQTLRDAWNVLESAKGIAETKTLYRMVFIQQYAGIEAYLSDRLIGEIENNKEALKRVVHGDNSLKGQSFTLREILETPDIVKREVRSSLVNRSYHDFPRIEEVWRIALKHDLFPDDELRTRMKATMKLRHDCVHRNGKDGDGNERTELSWEYLSEMDTDIRSLMRHVERSMND